MKNSTRYGPSRPAIIAGYVAQLQLRLKPLPIAAPVQTDRAGYRAHVQEWQFERTQLRIERAELQSYLQTSDVTAEIQRIESRLQDLDDFLIFEEDFDFDATPFDNYDEYDADLPDELDGSFHFSGVSE